jgi:SSS family solute:Na+ symporter
MGKLATIDIIIFLIYFVVVASYGIWIYKKKKSESRK